MDYNNQQLGAYIALTLIMAGICFFIIYKSIKNIIKCIQHFHNNDINENLL